MLRFLLFTGLHETKLAITHPQCTVHVLVLRDTSQTNLSEKPIGSDRWRESRIIFIEGLKFSIGLFSQSVHGGFCLGPSSWAEAGFPADREQKAHAPRRWAKAYRARVRELCVIVVAAVANKKGSIVIGSMTSHQIVRLSRFMRNSV